MPVIKTNIDQDAASLGAAALAANACGLWNGYDRIPSIHKIEDHLEPVPENAAFYEKLLEIYDEWTQTLARLGDKMNQIRL